MPQSVCALAVAMTGLHRKCGGAGGQRRPPLRNDKRRGWSWHAVYAYIRIYTIYTRKSLAEFAARRRQKNSNHFSPRHVRGEKYLSGCQCGILPQAAKLCAQQTASLLSEKPRRVFRQFSKRDGKGRPFSALPSTFRIISPFVQKNLDKPIYYGYNTAVSHVNGS